MTLIDIAASVAMDVPVSRAAYHIFMTAYLLIQDMMIVVWFMYALSMLFKKGEKGHRSITAAIWLLYSAYALLVLSNPWTELFFSLGPNMEYARGPLFLPCLVGLYYFYAIALLVLIIVRKKHIPDGYPIAVLVLQPIILSIAIPAQLLNPGWLVIFPAYTLCLLLAFLFFQNLRMRNEKEQLRQLTEVVEHFACGMAICAITKDKTLSVQYLSSGLGEICEMDAEKLRERFNADMLTGIHPEDRDAVFEAFRSLTVSPAECELTYRFITDSGSVKWLKLTAKPVEHSNGISLLYATYTDLTEQKRAEQQLRDSGRELRAKYELEKKRLSMTDENLLVHAVFNLTTGEALEYRFKDGTPVPRLARTAFTYGKANNAALLIDDAERERFLALNDADALLERFYAGETEFKLEYRRILSTGEIIWVRNSLHLLRDPNSGDVLLFEYWYNIEAEKMQELMFRSIATDNYDFVAHIDGKTKRFDVIAKAGLTYHMPPQSGENADAVTLSLYTDCVLPEDRKLAIENCMIETTKRHLRENSRFVFTYRMKLPDGTLRYKRVTQYYIDQQREIIVMMREDVTDLIREETEKNRTLADALAAANQASRAKSKFLSRVSHELRTPLNAIIGFMELAKDAPPEQMSTYLINSDAAAKQLLSIINDVLDVSSIESGKFRIAHTPFDFERLISNLRELYAPQFTQKGLRFAVRLLTAVDDWLVGDQLRVNQILFNLLSNALKFTSTGGVTLETSQRPAQSGTVVVRFAVSDTGCGMSEEMQERLFKPFEQESSMTAQKYGGNGLGLFIVGSLVSMMDGAMRVKSKQGTGSVFTIDLPFAQADSSAREQSLSADGSSAATTLREDMSDMRILLAEDNAMNRMVAENMMVKQFCAKCDCAEDGQVALDKFLASPAGYYDIIIMDIQMPNMDGLEATKRIRASSHPDASAVQIIALTANAFAEDIAKSLSYGMNAHVAKPIEPNLLCAAVEQAYSLRHAGSGA